MELSASFTENGVKFSPPAYIQRYGAICDLIKDDVRFSGKIQKVVDFGCAELSLFHYLKGIPDITTILEVDYDRELLERFQSRAEPLFYDHLFQRQQPLDVSVLKGSVSDPDYRLIGCDAVIAIELIEHLDVGVFDRLPHNVFGYIKPLVAIFTTPNADFNVLFPNLKDGGFRHLDHRFEWTREQFEEWANNIVMRYPEFSVEVSGIAPGPEGTEHLGCCSQMAVFYNNHYVKLPSLDPSQVDLDASELGASANPLASGVEEFTTSNAAGEMYQCSLPVTPGIHISEDLTDFEAGAVREELVNETQNQERCATQSLVPQGTQTLNIWDCRVWQNTLITNYYKPVAEYQYPFFVDPRTNEQKVTDHVMYYLKSFCNYDHKYYDEEQDLWRIPLSYLLSLCKQFEGLTLHQLRGILAETGYEVDAEYLIYKYFPDDSSYISEENQSYQDQDVLSLQGEVEQWDVNNPAQTWEAVYCQPGDEVWPCLDEQATYYSYPETYGSVNNTPEVVANEGYQDNSQFQQIVALTSDQNESDFIDMNLQMGETTENILNIPLPISTRDVCVTSNALSSAKSSGINIVEAPEQNPLQELGAIMNLPQQNSMQEVCPITNLPPKKSMQEVCPVMNLSQKNSLQEVCPTMNLSQKNSLQEVCPTMNLSQKNSMQDVCAIRNLPQKNSMQEVCPITNLPPKNSMQEVFTIMNLSQKNSLLDVSDIRNLPQKNSMQDVCAIRNLPQKNSMQELCPITNLSQKNSMQEVCPKINLSQKNSMQDVCAIRNLSQKNSMHEVCPITNLPQKNSMQEVCPIMNLSQKNSFQNVSATKNLPEKSSTDMDVINISLENSLQDVCAVYHPDQSPKEINTSKVSEQNFCEQDVSAVRNHSQHKSSQDICTLKNLLKQNSMQDVCDIKNLSLNDSFQDVLHQPEQPLKEINTLKVSQQNSMQDVCAIRNHSQHNSSQDVFAVNNSPEKTSSDINIVNLPQQNSLQNVADVENPPEQPSSEIDNVDIAQQNLSLHNSFQDVRAVENPPEQSANDTNIIDIPLQNLLHDGLEILILKQPVQRLSLDVSGPNHLYEESSNGNNMTYPRQTSSLDVCRCDHSSDEYLNEILYDLTNMSGSDLDQYKANQNCSENQFETLTPTQSDLSDLASSNDQNRNEVTRNICGSEFSCISLASHNTLLVSKPSDMGLIDRDKEDSKQDACPNTKIEQVKPVGSNTLPTSVSEFSSLSASSAVTQIIDDNTKSDLSNQENQDTNLKILSNNASNPLILSDSNKNQQEVEGDNTNEVSSLERPDSDANNLNLEQRTKEAEEDGLKSQLNATDLEVDNNMYLSVDLSISDGQGTWKHDTDVNVSNMLTEMCDDDTTSKDKDFCSDLLSDSGYMKSQDSPQSPNCSETFSNDLITPDKDIMEMTQSTILECIPENLNYVTQTSSSSPKGDKRSSSYRRKSIGPMTGFSENKEFSDCYITSMTRPKSLHVCMSTSSDPAATESHQEVFPSSLSRHPMLSPRNEINRPVHRHINLQVVQINDEEEPAQQNRPNFLELQNMVAVLDHQNNNVDYEGNNIDEEEGAGPVEFEAVHLLRQRMDIHNENHMAERENELDYGQGEEIVEEYRENYHEENYSNNPKLIAVPSLTSEAVISSHHILQVDDTILDSPHTQLADDTNLLITEKTLKQNSYVDFFPDKSPCCSKTCYDLMCDHQPSTSKGYSPTNNLDVERKKSGHCLETLHNIEEIYRTSISLLRSSNHSILSNDSSRCELAEASMESCLTIIGSHIHSCFTRSTSVHWDDTHSNLESEPVSMLNLDIRDELANCSSQEITAGQVSKSSENCADSLCKPQPSSTHTVDGHLVGFKSRLSTPLVVDHYNTEDQLILPDWIVRIMSETTDTPSLPVLHEEQEGETAFGPVEHQAGGDGACMNSYLSSHSSGHASMSSTTSHTNQSIMVPVERQAYSFMDIPYYRPPMRDTYQSSSSNSSIDLQLPAEVQDTVVEACHCEYCLANNSDSASHRNYIYHTQESNLATLRPKHNTVDAQDSSDDTYQSHTYQTITFALNCSNENGLERESQKSYRDEIQQPKSPIDLKDDSEYRLIECRHENEEPPPLDSSEYFRMSILHEINLHGVSSDMSGNYADVETDLDSEPD